MASGGTITGATSYPPPSYAEPEEEPDVIKAWREKRNIDIERRDQISAERKATTVGEARQAIDDFYESYNDKRDKSIAQTRKEADAFLASRDDTTAGGTSWERIGKLVDLSGKGMKGGATGTGKERFRELLISLRKDDKAPGATGL
jgi:Clathrin light chain